MKKPAAASFGLGLTARGGLYQRAGEDPVGTEHLAIDALASRRAPVFNLGNRLWHSHSSFKETPAKYSLLLSRSIDMRAAWDALPEKMKARVKDLVCWHSLLYSRWSRRFESAASRSLVRAT